MVNLDINIDLLIRKYVNGSLNDSEAIYLSEWIKASRQNALLFRATLASISSEPAEITPESELFCDTFIAENINSRMPRTMNMRRWSIAVVSSVLVIAVLVIAVFAVDFYTNLDDQSDVSQEQVIAKEETVESAEQSEMKCYRAPMDATRRITLQDGTVVILNQGSKLIVNAGYGVESRSVRLNGEAYFDVAKSAKQFTVDAGSRSYVVHGTSFNILSYEGERYAIVTLHTGKLEAKVGEHSYMLDPGEELRVDEKAKSISKHIVETGNSTSWIEKRLKFTRLPLKYVASQISHKYNTKINVHSAIEDIAYTGELRNEGLDTALSLLSKTSPVELSIIDIDGEYYISKSGI